MGILERVQSEYAYVTGLLRTLHRVTAIAKRPDHTYPQVVEELAARFGDKPALLSDGETLTFRDYDRRANRYARWAMQHGVEKGDAVCLFMPNRPEYLAIWLGIARSGGVTSLINTGLAGASLAHSVNIVRPKHIIVAAELVDAYRTALAHIEGSPAGLGIRGERAERPTPRRRGHVDIRRAADAGRAPATQQRRPLPLHLHERHHRAAQGGEHQSLPGAGDHERLLRRNECAGKRPDVSLPADVPLGRRRACGGCGADRRRIGLHPRPVFGEPVLDGRGRARVFALPVCRRTLPVPCQRAAASDGAQAQAPRGLRQWPAARHLGCLQGTLSHPEDSGVLRGDRG